MNIVQALNKAKTDILNFVTVNLQNKSDISHTHNEYALADDVDAKLEQINFKTLTEHLAEEDMILTSHQYGDKLPGEDGEPYTPVLGRIFFKRVTE